MRTLVKLIVSAIKSTNKTIKEEHIKVTLVERIKLYKEDVLLSVYTWLEEHFNG